jgi:hypothetical protein
MVAWGELLQMLICIKFVNEWMEIYHQIKGMGHLERTY